MVSFDLRPLLEGQMKVAKVLIAYNLLIIAPRGLGCQTNIYFSEFWLPS